MVKGVIFDLDGTLLDTIEDIADANNRMLVEFGYPTHHVNKYIEWIGNGARTLVEASLPPHARKENTLSYITKYKVYYEAHLNAKTKLFPEVANVLDALTSKNIPMAIVTNKPQPLANKVVNAFLSNWGFKSVIGHSNHFPHKPDTKGALHFAKQIECNPDQILFIGDSCVDIQTAIAAGMIPMGVSWGYGNPSLGGNNINVIHSPQRIIDYIKNTYIYENESCTTVW